MCFMPKKGNNTCAPSQSVSRWRKSCASTPLSVEDEVSPCLIFAAQNRKTKKVVDSVVSQRTRRKQKLE